MLRRLSFLLGLCVLFGCSKDVSVSGEDFYCVDDFECKSGFACNPLTNVCVLMDDLPEIVVDASVQPDASVIDSRLPAADLSGMDTALVDAAVVDAFIVDLAVDAALEPCENGLIDEDETGIDCGGACGPCEAGLNCIGDADCKSLACVDGLCQLPRCGDGVINGTETCDDGNEIDTDDCTAACEPARCGDGSVWAGVEQCDDGNAVDTDGCKNNCAAARCGDGVVQMGVEECDDGNIDSTDACTNLCMRARCGDRHVRVDFEECDDGNLDDTDACTASCVFGRCGDGIVFEGVEACDDGNADNTDGCLTNCERASCGDGVVHATIEACDDGNAHTESCDYGVSECTVCGDMCEYVPGKLRRCGDGVDDPEEACDDGNAFNDDACLNTCEWAQCGDGFLQVGVESCDDGNREIEACAYGEIQCEVCGERCHFQPGSTRYCGDGQLDPEEECDDGNFNPADECTNTCRTPRCGDGIQQANEGCDDGNREPQDGCDQNCQPEASCGNGRVEIGEDCDLIGEFQDRFCRDCRSLTSSLILPVNLSNCGALGHLGPSQSDCEVEYGLDVVIVEDGFQHVVIPASGTYRIRVAGAQGGGNGGLGALLSSEFAFNRGDVLRILVGHQGLTMGFDPGRTDGTGGGGGGTFVEHLTTGVLLMAAGGGGGGDRDAMGTQTDGQSTTRGGEETGSEAPWNENAPGDGGQAATGSNLTGYGGCGWVSRFDGESIAFDLAPFSDYCDAISLGGRGGRGSGALGLVSGGFGGGGVGDYESALVNGGGGGGGYSGGAGGGNKNRGSPGGGGGSYNIGANTERVSGVNPGNGRVIIELLEAR